MDPNKYKRTRAITITSASGARLSEDNPGWVCIPGETSNGGRSLHKVTEDFTVTPITLIQEPQQGEIACPLSRKASKG